MDSHTGSVLVLPQEKLKRRTEATKCPCVCDKRNLHKITFLSSHYYDYVGVKCSDYYDEFGSTTFLSGEKTRNECG